MSRMSSVWPVVSDERIALIDDLGSLSPEQWQTPSLCPGWDVHDVLAHLVDSAKTTRVSFMLRLIGAGFDFDKDNDRGVARERRDDPRRTLEEFRAVIERTSGPPAPLATRLVEAFAHGEDIRRPLGITRDYPPASVARALDHQLGTTIKIGGGREHAEGLRLCASDTDYGHGAGEEVRGTAIALLLAVSGRPVAPTELSGPGAALLTQRASHNQGPTG